jgi:hypothetical protein
VGVDRKEKNVVRFHKSQLAGSAAIAAVLALAGTLLVSRGVVDALLMIVIVAVLTGMYRLRRYARAVLLYRRFELHRRHPDDELVSSEPPAGRGDVMGVGGAGAVHHDDERQRRAFNRT